MKFSNILLIENNQDDAELALISLSSLDNIINDIIHIKDGEEALDYLFAIGKYSNRNKLEVPALILLDLKMPKVGGIEVLHKIKQDEVLKDIPVVVFTSSNEEKDIISSLKNGANSFIQKPVDGYEYDKTLKEIGLFWLNQSASAVQ